MYNTEETQVIGFLLYTALWLICYVSLSNLTQYSSMSPCITYIFIYMYISLLCHYFCFFLAITIYMPPLSLIIPLYLIFSLPIRLCSLFSLTIPLLPASLAP